MSTNMKFECVAWEQVATAEFGSIFGLKLWQINGDRRVLYTLYADQTDLATPDIRTALRPGWVACLKSWVSNHNGEAWYNEDALNRAVWDKMMKDPNRG